MDKENIVVEKSYAFALRIVKLYKYLVENKHEWVLTKQVLRSGTSIGANVEEAIGAQSRKDFVSKVNIAYKECRETNYWLRLLKDSNYLEVSHYKSISEDCRELQRILAAIVLKTKANQS
jgi:four helix bundle protein